MTTGIDVATKSDAVYQVLKNDLLTGQIRGGERMVISDLATKYHVSPMPVREAIKRLQQEGWVDFVPHLGAVAKSIDIDKFREMVEVRTQLEILATVTATPKINQRALRKLEGIVERMEKNIGSTTMNKFMTLDRKFHFAIYEHSPNAFLVENVDSLWERTTISQYIFAWDSTRAVDSHEEHKGILQAITQKDAQLAGELLKQHKDNSLDRLTGLLNTE